MPREIDKYLNEQSPFELEMTTRIHLIVQDLVHTFCTLNYNFSQKKYQ